VAHYRFGLLNKTLGITTKGIIFYWSLILCSFDGIFIPWRLGIEWKHPASFFPSSIDRAE
jgi:hypothetical protein